ncbi:MULTISPECIES: hypothetical protein [Nocardiaceae]|jgi:hypothetical protein|uniref:hypothetical protein n=1 Tax=Nocardiaceae TaxID=85025 RepID=UPI001E5BE788|nr:MULTISPECIES: hypothetical protein [Rhodococcus]MCC8929045.1 hypothetical protein [Rhodococcus sp. I2R]MCZ4278130.1 hypothetical protein [Rhodococcus yunnanensis]
MGDPNQPTTYWQSLAIAADQGHLFLNPSAASACYRACDEYIAKLRDHQTKAGQLGKISGWGDFKSGTELRDMFAAKAVGGDDNMVDVLQSHIDVVEQMQVVFKKFFTATDNVDETNAADVRAQGPK